MALQCVLLLEDIVLKYWWLFLTLTHQSLYYLSIVTYNGDFEGGTSANALVVSAP